MNLVVSSGPARVDVPPVTGSAEEQARGAVSAAGLETGEVTREYSQQPEGTVLSQEPAVGASVEEGTRVGLTVATSTPQGPPPSVVGQDTASARSTLEDLGYTVRIDSPVGSHLDRVVRQREDGTTVVLTVL